MDNEVPIHTVTEERSDVEVSASITNVFNGMTEHTRSAQYNYSRLPKLVLPTFNDNPLQWQTFWASFKAAVDSNPCLSQVQKFSYLCQLQGDAAHVISGLPLTETKYMHSIALLRERFWSTVQNG